MNFRALFLLFLILTSCVLDKKDSEELDANKGVQLIVLGTVQDAGSPQIGCKKECCSSLFDNPIQERKIVSLGLLDHDKNEQYLFDCSPDFPTQLNKLNQLAGVDLSSTPNGVFITHAHTGHYTGLMHLGKEAMNASNVPVYVMPRMDSFLVNNGPWSQLVTQNNIILRPIKHELEVEISENIRVTPIQVPHRDEYSETVGYKIKGPNKSALFIPDIDKWSRWEKDIIKEIEAVDLAFIDATFFDGAEINNRDISQIPHPFVIESIELFESLSENEKKKVYFIHLNHTNPLLNQDSKEYQIVVSKKFNVAQYGQEFDL